MSDRILDLRMWLGAGFIGVVIAAATLLTLDVFLPGGLVEGRDSLAVARTAAFTTLVLAAPPTDQPTQPDRQRETGFGG